jgi:hypothetical protein
MEARMSVKTRENKDLMHVPSVTFAHQKEGDKVKLRPKAEVSKGDFFS